jgi:dipeptidase E
MSIYLYSSGDWKENLKGDMNLPLKDEMTITFVPTEPEDKEWSLECFKEIQTRFTRLVKNPQFNILYLNSASSLDIQIALKSDMIYLSGGNTYSLLHHLKKTGLINNLKDYAKHGILAGHSAGGIVLTNNINTASFPDFDKDDNELGLKNLVSMDLVDFEMFPHYQSKGRYSHTKHLIKYSTYSNRYLIALEDGASITGSNNKLQITGNARIFYKGQAYTKKEFLLKYNKVKEYVYS